MRIELCTTIKLLHKLNHKRIFCYYVLFKKLENYISTLKELIVPIIYKN